MNERNERLVETADRIGARICRDAVWAGRECSWIAAQRDGSHAALDTSLYRGTSGIAWFLLHLFAATGEKAFRITAEGAIRQAIGRPNVDTGFHAGRSGIAYVAAWAARITGREDYAEQSRQMLRATDPVPARIDITEGSAGAIPVLLSEGFLEHAVRHGEFLLHCAVRRETGWSWKTLPQFGRNLTGFAHGAAGIGWALLELFQATGDGRFREAGLQAFAYEENLFDAEAQNWPDLRPGFGPFSTAWCHGAPGIGFSRLRAFEILGDEACRTQAETAIRTTAQSLDSLTNYSLCHGVGGNAELLLSAARTLHAPAYAAPAYRAAEAGIQQYEDERAPWPCGDRGEGETPGLMVGIAGIGYFLLRLWDPGRFPSILLPPAA